MNVAIRSAMRSDAPGILAITNHYIARSTSTFRIELETLDERLEWLDEHAEAHPVIVAELDGTIVGWAALSTYNTREGYRYTAEISVYVRPEFHRRGIGRALLTELITRARAVGHHVLLAICCAESTESIALHQSLGFTRAGVIHEVGRKFDRWLDVVFLELRL